MKVGDIFYFVDNKLGRVSKRKIVECVPPCTQGKSESVSFTGGIKTHPIWVYINPTPENYFCKHTKFFGSSKTYFIFTEVEAAQKALVEYVLPNIIEKQQRQADEIIKQYNKLIQEVEKTEIEIKSNTEKFYKKCNALKNKFV